MLINPKISFQVSDTTGQRNYRITSPGDRTVGEVLDHAASRLALDRMDMDGNRLELEARRERGGLKINRSDRVADALQDEDHVRLHPRVTAG